MIRKQRARTEYRLWSEDDDTRLREAMASGLSIREAARLLGRPPKATRCHWRWINQTASERTAHYERLRSSAAKVAPPLRPRDPPHIFQDRERRRAAEQSITGILMGDPPRGYSAFDRKLQEQPA